MEMKVERLCCFRLSHAALAIGFITSITAFLNIFELLGALIAFDDRELSFHINSYESPEIIGLEIFGYILVFISGWLLIQGTIKKSHRMILPWLILSAFGILFGIGCALLFLVFCVIGNWDNDFGQLFIMSFFGILFFPGLGIYIWAGIFSLYRNIREKNQEALAEVEGDKLWASPYSNPQIIIPTSNYYRIDRQII